MRRWCATSTAKSVHPFPHQQREIPPGCSQSREIACRTFWVGHRTPIGSSGLWGCPKGGRSGKARKRSSPATGCTGLQDSLRTLAHVTTMKRSHLKRSTKPLRRTPIRRRSKRTESLYARKNGRREFVAQQLLERLVCEAQTEVCTGRSIDLHEPLRRSKQGSILDVENSMAVCRLCHGWIHQHPRLSGERRWLINKWTPVE